jgi:hypothetical protein
LASWIIDLGLKRAVAIAEQYAHRVSPSVGHDEIALPSTGGVREGGFEDVVGGGVAAALAALCACAG